MKSENIKKFGCVLLSAIMLSGISVCAVSAEEKSTEIHIVHTNDIHGYYQVHIGRVKSVLTQSRPLRTKKMPI